VKWKELECQRSPTVSREALFASYVPFSCAVGVENSEVGAEHRATDAHPREKAHSIGRPAILFDNIMWALYKNAQTRALYSVRAGPISEAA